jgi:DNA-binding NtrC family response regulator
MSVAEQNQASMVGASPALAAVRRFIAKAAPTGSTVLIQGESGTGKELAALDLHANSARRGGPFVAVNCAALPDSLVESVLFGHEKGAFTGAGARSAGKFELASGGTMFLDEVGDLSSPAQAKLLRAIQERRIDRIGGTHPVPIDVRLIAATNRNLEAAAATGAFREDLYYRLKVLCVRMPALRERPEDILTLAVHFLRKYAEMNGRPAREISPQAQAALRNHHWPGNVRQLEHAMEQAAVLGESETIGMEDLPEDLLRNTAGPGAAPKSYREIIYETRRRALGEALEVSEGDPVEAAARLGVHPNGIRRMARELNLEHLLRRRRNRGSERYGKNGFTGTL